MRNSITRAKDIMTKIEEFSEMKGRTGELEILKSIINDLSHKKFELDKNQFLDYFSPFAIRSMSL